VEPYEGLPNDDCGDASGRPAIHEGESPGENGNARERVLVARALRPPPQPAR
jgi:hypothetical protein